MSSEETIEYWDYPVWRISCCITVGPSVNTSPSRISRKMSYKSSLVQYRECPVCLEDMLHSDPRSLNCLHSFCCQCLRGMKTSNYYTDKFSYSITCPTCRAVTKLNSMSDLQTSVMYKQAREVIDKLYAGRLCQLCTEVEPTQWCEVCDQRLCDECRRQHDAIVAFRDHTFHGLTRSRLKCSRHGKDMIYVCVPCGKEVCFDCVRSDHADHNDRIEEYGKYMNQHVGEIRHCRDDIAPQGRMLEERLEAMRDYDRSLRAIKEEIRNASTKAMAQIKNEADEMTKLIDDMMSVNSEQKSITKELLTDTGLFLKESAEDRKDSLTKVEQVSRLYEKARRILKLSANMKNLTFQPVAFVPKNHYSIGSLEGVQMSTTESDVESD